MVASEATLNDYVTSNELVSMALAMVSEQREVNVILKELFSAYGNEMYVCTVLRVSHLHKLIYECMYVCMYVCACVQIPSSGDRLCA
jgi:PHP family Zn ribbon phosphoesterase